MKRGIYLIKDDVAGTFDFYGTFVNDAVASRTFKVACTKSDDIPVDDLSLFYAGSYDSDTGCIILPDTGFPSFIMRGEVTYEV